MRGLDIAIAGCGPCGLAAALLLHRAGHHVTLFERFDTPRPIGSGLMLQPTGLVRDWGGASHHVVILEYGFLYRDRRYGSLTQIAFDITGAKWSGPRFFGLVDRKKKPNA